MVKGKVAFPELDREFLERRIEESIAVVKKALRTTDKPLVVQFSGGRDSMAMLGLVREATSSFICSYMQTDIDFKESVEFAKQSAKSLEVELLISTPADHLGGFFQRLEKFRKFPTVRLTWCTRDLKVRPQQKMLNKIYGRGNFVKMVGVRRSESSRRMSIYKWGAFNRKEYQVSGANLVYPILHWTDADVVNYLNLKGLPTSGLYKKYGVSGCCWCPFYQPDIYRAVLQDNIGLYDEFIEWEEKIGPSVGNYVYLKDIKEEIMKYSGNLK